MTLSKHEIIEFLAQEFQMPFTTISPIGVVETSKFIRQIEQILNQLGHSCNYTKYIEIQTRFVSQSAWFSRSIDCQNLAGKTAVVFGDATHAAALTKILVKEMGVEVLLSGTYCKGEEDWFKEQVGQYDKQLLFTLFIFGANICEERDRIMVTVFYQQIKNNNLRIVLFILLLTF